MINNSIVDALEDANIVEQEGSEHIALDQEFRERVRERQTIDDDAGITDGLSAAVADADERDLMRSLVDTDETFVRRFLAVREFAPEIHHAEAILATFVVGLVEDGSPPTDGAPDGFLPIRGDQLETAVQLYRRAVVYVWLHDCEPCDKVKRDLELAFEESPEEVALFAVYGPDSPELLDDLFDVPGGPATLFVRNGRVEVRLYGSYGPNLVRAETEKLCKMDA